MALGAEPRWQERRLADTQAALDRGVFGAPCYVIGDDIFWGQDRLEFVRAASGARLSATSGARLKRDASSRGTAGDPAMTDLPALRRSALDWIGANEARHVRLQRTHLALRRTCLARIQIRRAPMWISCAPRASRSRKAPAACRPPSSRAGVRAGRCSPSFSEYDAVPGNCQAVVPRREPRAGMHPYAAGHTDPHSSLGTAALTAMLAAKAAMSGVGHAGPPRAVRRTGGEGLRVEARPCGEGLLRRPRRRRGLPPAPAEHRHRRDAVRRLLVAPSSPSPATAPRPGSTSRCCRSAMSAMPRPARPARPTRCA